MLRLLALALLFALAFPVLAQPDGRLVVLNKGEATASVIDVVSGETLARIPTGIGPHEVAVAPDGRHAVVTDYGDQHTVGATLTVLDLDALDAVRTIELGGYERPHGIAFLPDGRLAITAELDSAVVVVDLEAPEGEAVAFAAPTGGALSHMLALALDGRHAFTANMRSGTVSKVDLDVRRVAVTAATGPVTEAVAVRPGGAEVWAASQEAGRLVVLDAATMGEVGSLDVDGRPIRIAFTPDGARALVTAVVGSELVVVDADAREVVGTVSFPNGPETANAAAATVPGGTSALPIGVALAPDGRTAFVALMGRDEVAVVDLVKLEVARWIATGSMPDGIAYLPR